MKKINPLFDTAQNPYTVFTSKTDTDIAKACKEAVASLWLASDINLTTDAEQWNTMLDKKTQDYIKQVLAFFVSSDGLVNDNIVVSFIKKVRIPEVRYFYATQIFHEVIHSETYSNLITTFIQDDKERDRLFNAIETIPIIKKKAQWCEKWMGDNATFWQSLVAFLAVEGIFFSSSFASIFWLRSNGILANSLGVANEYIMIQETQHANFASLLLQKYGVDEIDKKEITQIIKEATEIEKEFVEHILPEDLIGMNAELMSQYVEYVADVWLQEVTGATIYNVKQPFEFMHSIGVSRKDNFFEKTRTNYAHKTEANKNFDNYQFDLND